jgi:hypothetical protein
MTLTLYNTLIRRKEVFEPFDPTMCGSMSAGRRCMTAQSHSKANCCTSHQLQNS